MKKVRIGQILLGGLILVGIGWSVWDYRNWRKDEFEKYGHGYGEEIPALILGNLYENQFLGVRIRYPGGWLVDEAEEFVDVAPKITLANLLGISERRVIVWLGKNVKVSVERVQESFVDLVDKEEQKIKAGGMEFLREREHMNTEEVGIVFFTWRDGGVIHQRALAEEEGRLIIVDSDAIESEWKNLETTFREMYKSLIIF